MAFELTFVLFFVLLALTPLQSSVTRHLTVVQSLDASHAVISGDIAGLVPGSQVTLYRFNHDWKAPIGSATVEALTLVTARISVDPSKMSWPLGRHGVVAEDQAGNVYVSLGSTQGMSTGEYVSIYRDRINLGQAHILKVENTRSQIQLPVGIDEVAGLTASEFSFATQAVVFDNPHVSALEIAIICLTMLLYVTAYLRTRRSPFIMLGERLRRLNVRRSFLFWVAHLVAGVPFIWFIAKMPLYLIAYVAGYVSQHVFSHFLYLYPLVDSLLPYLYVLFGFLYCAYLVRFRQSPILRLWKFLSYNGKSSVSIVSFKRGLLLWALHLVIVYVFAWTLWGFFRGDLQGALAIGFPAPSREAAFEQAKLFIWALTVIGVLIGYGYSVISILWGKYIRNLDFTVVGWLTNGFCYPFLGIVIWQMIPSFTGADPIITAGPLQELMLWLGLILNLLYMLSIFNLGILFDLMADKGVRTSGFYSVIRHPNYLLEVCMFFVTELVGLTSGIQWLAISMYFFIYWIRSEREDNFMEYSNPAYTEYQKKVPYKFLPGIY